MEEEAEQVTPYRHEPLEAASLLWPMLGAIAGHRLRSGGDSDADH